MGSEGWLCGARYEGGLAVGVDGDWWKLWTYPGTLLTDRFSCGAMTDGSNYDSKVHSSVTHKC